MTLGSLVRAASLAVLSVNARASRNRFTTPAPIVEAAIRKGVKGIWMQEGVVHERAAQKARAAGIFVIMDRCILKEHRARFG